MKASNILRSTITAMVVSTGLAGVGIANAADTSMLIGKNLDQNRALVDTVMKGRNYMVEVDANGKIKQVIDAGANGDGTDALPAVHKKPASNQPANLAAVELPENYQGQEAINFIGPDLAKVAANYGFTPDKLSDLLLNDDTARIDSNNRLFYVDNSIDQHAQTSGLEPSAAGVTTADPISTGTAVPIASPSALANAFKLHSKPGASKTIYLNFVGYTASQTAWSTSTITAPPYDLNGVSAVFDDNERSNIISIWNRVTEDFIPFDVDVTTEPPSSDAIIRTSTADNTYGTQVVITKSGTISCSCGGVAYVGVASFVNNTYYQPAWVFQQALGNNEKNIAEAASHEAGHTLGLVHDGQKVGTGVNSYYMGHGADYNGQSADATTGWAPIMGAGYNKNVTQWDRGVYPGANNQQDDIATLAANGILPRTDDVGNTIATASSITNVSTTTTADIQTFGIISTSTDVDMYIVNTTGGAIKLSASPTDKGPNLDVQLTLYKADGSVVLTDAPANSLSATINTSVPAGTYYLAVGGSGRSQASASDFGYSNYASLGQYKITGTYQSPNNSLVPVAVLNASSVSGPAAFTVNFSAANSVAKGTITNYQWTFGDGSSSTSAAPVHTYSTVGTYMALLTVTNQYGLSSTRTMQITVTAPVQLKTARVLSLAMQVVKSNTLSAKVSVLAVDELGRVVPNATVTGTWAGVFSGTSTGLTTTKGTAVLSSNVVPVAKGSAIFTVGNISAAGYSYKPTLNTKSVITVSW